MMVWVVHVDNSTNYPFTRARKEIISSLSMFPKSAVLVINWNRDGKIAPVFASLKKRFGNRFRTIDCSVKSGAGTSLSVWAYMKYVLFVYKQLRVIKAKGTFIAWPHNLPSAIPVFLFKWFSCRGLQVVYDVHDIYPAAIRSPFFRFLASRIDTFFAKKSSFVLVPTERIDRLSGLREYYLEKGVKGKNLVTLWNAPMKKEFSTSGRLSAPNHLVVGYVGQIRSIAPLKRLIESLDILNKDGVSAELFFVGGGHNKSVLESFVAKKSFTFPITFYNMVDASKIADFYQRASVIFSVYALPDDPSLTINQRGALQTKVLEAAALGVPSLVPAYVLSGDFVRKFNVGIAIKNVDVHSLTVALKKVKPLTSPVMPFIWEYNDQSIKEIFLKFGFS